MANVLLLRSPSTGDDDRYSSAFTPAGYHSVSAPVLETVPTNLNRLTEIVRAGPIAEGYDGVIITSARSCEAWNTVVGDLIQEYPSDANISASGLSCLVKSTFITFHIATEWSSIPFYVVGKATASALSSIRAAYGQTPYTPGATLGESSGTGEHLANFILSLESPSRPKKVLYLTGDKNRDTVPRILEKAGIMVVPVKVYETQFSSTFAHDLEAVLQSASKGSYHFSKFIWFLSPSHK
jgi:uroporphyrinogen-III synthase